MSPEKTELDEEIDSWKGFGWALRKDFREVWDRMLGEARETYGGAVEASGMPIKTDPFFMALLLLQQRMIQDLRAELEGAGVDLSGLPTANETLDGN